MQKLFAAALAASLAGAALVSSTNANALEVAPLASPAGDVLNVQYGGWYPGKGMMFCRAHPGNYRCNRGYGRPVAVYGRPGWYPGKGMEFCRFHPGNWRCHRGY